MIFHPKIGDKINKDDKLVELFTDKEEKIDEVKKSINKAITVDVKSVEKFELIKKVLK